MYVPSFSEGEKVMEKPYNLIPVPTKEIEFSRNNPRGEKPEQIKKDKTFEQLKDSVAQFGVLVPIVVHKKKRGKRKKYILVDGERRLRAALSTGIEKIPAHIAEAKERMGDLVQAFHIHMLRKQWKPIAQARAFKRIKAELKKKTNISEEELLKDLQAQTGCTDTQLESLERAIRYSDETLRDVDDGKIQWSYLVQFEASFIEQLEQHYPSLLKKFGINKVREVLVNKARKKVLTGTRALMINVVPVITRAKTKNEKKLAKKLLTDFINNKEMPARDIKKRYEKKYPTPQNLVELAGEVIDTSELLTLLLQQIDIGQLICFHKKARDVNRILEELRKIINRKTRQLRSFIK